MLTEEQRQRRQAYIGASDAPAILGVDGYRNAVDVYFEKRGSLDHLATSDAMLRGNLLEPAVLSYAARELGVELQRDEFVTHADWPRLCANLDGRVVGKRAGVEAKTTVNGDEWGEPGTDQVPDRVLVQTHQQMLVADLDLVYVPVLLPAFRRFDFRLYVVQRDDDLAQHIGRTCTAFYEEHVVTNVRPVGSVASLETVKRIRRHAGESVTVEDEIVRRWLEAKQAERAAKDQTEAAERDLLTAIGTAEQATYSRGEVTYRATTRKAYAVAETTYRTLRHKAAKELV